LGKNSSGSYIRISDLVKKFDTVVAVNHVSLEIPPGSFVTLLGPSGSGKTTILKIVAGFEQQTEGEVFIDDEPMSRKPPYKRNVGMVFQNYALFPHLTVAENIAFPLRMRKFSQDIIKKEIRRVLEMVKLSSEYESRYPKQLSGGQQQRIALVRSLVFNPSVLLMDEPLGALDKKLREHMQIEIKKIQKEVNITVIYVTHDQSEALNMSDIIAVLNEGRLQQIGSPRDLYENPANLFVADFIGESNFIKGKVTSVQERAYWVATDAECEIKALSDRFFPEGSEVVVALHPEKIRILSLEDKSLNIIKGRISEVIYLGEITKYYVSIKNGQTILTRHHNKSGIKNYRVGEDVIIGWSYDDCRLIT
jgi:putative spermidine/putrescine transport system ATP-binding protein